uniref:Anion exchange protein n=1 Tax=Panagrellus redivivus TaxID=6233 RepID=A0A7E4VER9_PANRE
MPLRANNAGPDIRGSTSSVSRRKASFSEQIPARLPSVADNGADVLADSLYITQGITLGNHPDTPIDNVRQIVEGNFTDPPQLFCEMMYLSTGSSDDDDPAPLVWEQLSRWIKYEQKVEGDGTRFSKPHITLLNIQSLIQLKNCIRKGTVLLDEKVSTFVQLVERVIQAWTDNGSLSADQNNYVKDVLYASKLHLIDGKLRRINELQNDDQFNRRGSHLTAIDSDVSHDPKANGNGDNISVKSDSSDKFENADTRLLKKLPSDTNSAVILVATVDALEKPLTAFIRLAKPTLLYPEIPDHPVPAKFVFIVLNPRDNYQNETVGIGRTMGALFADEIFKKVAFHAPQKFTIGDAIEEFLTQVVAIPPGKCSTDTRWEPHEESEHTPRNIGMLYANYDDPFDDNLDEKHHEINIVRSGRICGGLVDDIKRKSKWFVSDFTDFFKGRLSQSFAVVVFMFFANITSIITFGAVMERALNHQIAAIENIVCGGISGIIFGMFSGQPLNILSATGPTLVFEKILYDFCTGYHWEFLPFRFWVGVWVAIYLMIMVVFDFSALVGLITRFTEEAFATLISVVFIIQAFEKIYEIGYEAPITIHPEEVLHSTCHCLLEDTGPNGSSIVRNLSVGVTRCQELGGKPEGLQCFFKPDVYMFSIVLMFGTFVIAFTLSRFRTSRYFSSKIRNSVSDFGVLIAIVLMTALTHVIGLEVPSLKVPSSLRPTLDRPWIIDITNVESISVCFIAAVPALFYTILITMDQQITAVIVNRKDNLLRKGYGYHLDLFVIAILVITCSLLGLPFYVAATVLSVMHIDALKLQSECAAPGEKPTFLGVKEQRVTAVLAHVIILCSVFLTSLIKLVPMPVLTGIFLYMGVVSLLGQQFIQRIMLVFMPIKHQPDYTWLRNVRMKRVHLFTLIQALSILGLFAVKYAKTISMVFPLMLVFMVIIRMFVLERLFNHRELLALDDDVPTFSEVMTAPKKTVKSTKLKTLNESGTETTALKGADDDSAFA